MTQTDGGNHSFPTGRSETESGVNALNYTWICPSQLEMVMPSWIRRGNTKPEYVGCRSQSRFNPTTLSLPFPTTSSTSRFIWLNLATAPVPWVQEKTFTNEKWNLHLLIIWKRGLG